MFIDKYSLFLIYYDFIVIINCFRDILVVKCKLLLYVAFTMSLYKILYP